MITHLTSVLVTLITNLYIETGLVGIFLTMALESCYIPLPASEVVIPIAGVLVARGHVLPGVPLWVGITLVSLTSAAGCLIGSMLAYAIGHTGGRQALLKYGSYLLITQHDTECADQFFQRWGRSAAFSTRLLPVVRTWASLPAGVSKMPFLTFCIYTFLGSLLWCSLWTCLGAFLGNNIDLLKTASSTLSTFVFVLCAVLVVLYIWSRIRAIRRDRSIECTGN